MDAKRECEDSTYVGPIVGPLVGPCVGPSVTCGVVFLLMVFLLLVVNLRPRSLRRDAERPSSAFLCADKDFFADTDEGIAIRVEAIRNWARTTFMILDYRWMGDE